MARFCTQCGTQNKDEAKFCIGCGQPMPGQVGSPDAGKAETQNGREVVADVSHGQPVADNAAANEAKNSDHRVEADDANAQSLEAIKARIEAEDRARAAAFAAAQIRMTVQEAAERAKAERAARRRNGEKPKPDSAPPGAGSSSYSWDQSPQQDKPMRGSAAALVAVVVLAVGAIWWGQQRHDKNTPTSAASVPLAMTQGEHALASAPGSPMPEPQAVTRSKPELAGQHADSETKHAPVRVETPPSSVTHAAAKRGEKKEPVMPHAKKHAVAKEARQKSDNKAQAQSSASAPEPKATPMRTPPPSVAATPVEGSEVARVQVLQQALAACQDKGNFFTRQVCIQETRWKYCSAPSGGEPLWGKVPECPGSTRRHDNP